MSNKLENARVLVIGAAGFIGGFVVSELLKEPIKELIIYDNFARGEMNNIENSLKDERCSIFPYGGDIREVDILDKAMEGIDYVFHLAAMWLLHCKDFPRTAFDVNIAGTFNVLEACVKHKVKKLIYSSSASVYGDAEQVPMTEEHPFANKNFYGATKIAGEAMCTAYNDRYNLEIIGLRYMNVYGPGQDQHAVYSGVVPIVLNKIDKGEAPMVNGDGSQAYDFIYVEDIARCNIAAVKSDIKLGYYNVGTEIQTTIKELCETMLKLKNSDLKINYIPYSEDDAKRYFRLTDRFASNVSIFSKDFLNKDYDSFEKFNKIFSKYDTSIANKMSYYDLKTFLPSLLHVEDRTSMANGLESRVPLLDHRVIEFAATIPAHIKFKDGITKYLPKKVFKNVIPNSILDRKDKKGFPTPTNLWFKTSLNDWVNDLLSDKRTLERGLYEKKELLKLINGSSQFNRSLWGVINLELWHRKFID